MWSAKCKSVEANPDGLTLTLVYELTDGAVVDVITEARVSSVDSIDEIMGNAVTYRNRVEAQKAAIAALNPKDFENVSLDDLKARKAPPAPSQDELDQQAWFALKADWQKKQKIVESGLSKAVVQSDVDTAYAAMKQAYKEEYGAFL